jgi:hypothetical protein
LSRQTFALSGPGTPGFTDRAVPSQVYDAHADTNVFSRKIPRTPPELTSVTGQHTASDLGKRFLIAEVAMTGLCL